MRPSYTSILVAGLSAVLATATASAQADDSSRLAREWELAQDLGQATELIPVSSSSDPLATSSSGPELFVTLHAGAFDPVLTDLESARVTDDFGARYCDGFPCTYFADAPVPHAASIIGAELDACNLDRNAVIYMTLWRMGAAETSRTELFRGFLFQSGCGRFFARLGSTHVADQFNNSYAVFVRIGDIFDCAFPPQTCPTKNQRFLAVRLYYEVAGEGTVEPKKSAPFHVFPP